MLLAGRSLSTGSPWGFIEERLLIAEERDLWEKLSPSEQVEEQQFLISLWEMPVSERFVETNPEWGEWASGKVQITNAAFGLPRQDYRPYPKGLPLETYPNFVKTVQWLWDRGFQVIDINDGVIAIAVQGGRVIPEVERLYKLLVQSFPTIQLKPHGSLEGTQIRALYDPVGCQTSLEISGFGDTFF